MYHVDTVHCFVTYEVMLIIINANIFSLKAGCSAFQRSL